MEQQLQEFLKEHAISERVGGNGRYVRFEQGKPEVLKPSYDGFPELTAHVRSVVGQQSGLAIIRNGYTRRIPPQLRPDRPVYTSKQKAPSYHPDDPIHPLTGRQKRVWHQYKRPVRDKKTGEMRSGRWVYALPLGEQRNRHIAKHHGGINQNGLHMTEPDDAKYVIPPGEHGKWIDVHPLALELMPDAERVYFVIEGSLKNDAVLSYILANGMRASVFCVPSVTLWPAGTVKGGPFAPELREFIAAMNLCEKMVVIVPDADWYANGLVVAQAMLCREYLKQAGVHACVAAPPLTEQEREILRLLPCTAEGALSDDTKQVYAADVEAAAATLSLDVETVYSHLRAVKAKKGVDDFLALGHSLDDLHVVHREGPDPATALAELRGYGWRTDRLLRNVRALMTFPLFANEHGELDKNLCAFAAMLRCGRETARKAVVDLVEVGVLQVEEGDTAADFTWPREDPVHNYEWEDRPRLTIAEKFRAKTETLPLRERPLVRRQETEVDVVAAARA